ncbi:primase-helicase zinc-binding domain-containing protein [Mesorhizobium sp. GbtcB19]|uniref:DUF7146 domain-containing protein n=1 Tax=Mesorhizobium sp. GbtcB19 TaxID=2824764 RepID=UPI001C2FFA86|nr:primase-helicase zinc-binding domain-containing protein [Mesorhizobium sp. GbtcB19]
MIPAATIAKARDLSIVDVALALGAAQGVKVDERGVPCPACGGTDRFSVDSAKNVFLCRWSGAGGDPIALVQHVNNCSFGEAIEHLTGEKPLSAGRRAPSQDDAEKNQWREKARRRAWKIWQDGAPIEPERGGHWVRDYLGLRAIPFPAWRIKALREVSHLPYWHHSKAENEFRVIHTGPAMLAAITGPDGHFMGVHRTWLDLKRPNGKAAIVDPETGEILDAKKVEGSQKGGKVVLRNPHFGMTSGSEHPSASRVSPTRQDDGSARANTGGGYVTDAHSPVSSIAGVALAAAPALILGEGIETVLSWDALHPGNHAALWCGLNIGNIAGKAAEQIPHPSLTMTDSLGRKRRRKVGGHEPDLTDADCLQVPADDFDTRGGERSERGYKRIILLGDGDSDRFTTEAAMLRARKRFQLAGHDCGIDWAPDGQDFNDQLRGMMERARPATGRAA